MKVVMTSVAEIKPYDKNPRKNDAAVDRVAASIREFGFRQPIVVDAGGVIIIGHTRHKAAVLLGLEKVPVHRALDMPEDKVRALRIADNKLGELAEWDEELLAGELAALRDAEIDLEDLGFDLEELSRLIGDGGTEGLTDPDDVPAPPDAAKTKPGDLWVLGNHRLLCGDSSKPEDIDRLLGGQTIHLVNMDPPYNVKVEPRSNNAIAAGLSSFQATHHQKLDVERHPEKSKPTQKKLRAKDRPLANDFVSDGDFDRLLDAWFGNAARVLREGGGFYIWGGYANCANYPPALQRHELYLSQAIIWIKEHAVLTRKDFMGNHEWCFYGWKEGAAHRFYGPANVQDTWEPVGPPVLRNGEVRRVVELTEEAFAELPSDVWNVKKVSPQKMVHLTEKPVELARRAMAYSSLPGENVLDLFGGSGSTLIAAEICNRHAFLMELDQLYCDVIVERWEKFTGRKAELAS